MSTLSDSDEVTATEEQKDGTLPMEAKLLKTDILSKASLETLYTSPVEIILSQATVHDHQSPSTTPGALPPSPPSPPSPSSTEYLDEFSSCGALLLSQKLRNLELQSRESSEMDPSCLLTPPNTPHTCVQMALGTWRGGHKERTLTFQKAWIPVPASPPTILQLSSLNSTSPTCSTTFLSPALPSAPHFLHQFPQ
ncbi:uncharacterized protein LOC144461936 isoform X2 [Epinephelus lanceolatus]